MPADPLTICLITAGLAIGGWLINRKVTHHDQRKERIAKFLRDMREREQEIIIGLGRYHYAGESFSNWRGAFIVEAKTLESDFLWRRGKLRHLVQGISDMQPGHVDTNAKDANGELIGPRELFAAIQKLIVFLE